MKKYFFNLQKFAEGGGDAASGAGGTAGGEENSHDAGGKNGQKGSSLENVKYGIQEETSGTESEETAAVEKEGDDASSQNTKETKNKSAAFEEMIKGEFKDEFGSRVNKIIGKRFAEAKQAQEQLTEMQPILDILADKYGGNPEDVKSLLEAIQRDNSFYEEAATAQGLTVDQFKKMKELERENESLRRTREQVEAQKNADKIYSQWMQESETVKQIYPTFDFRTETQNEEFNSLLKHGIDVKTAYEVIHKDEIIGGAMQYAVQQARQKTVNDIQARGTRAKENGSSSQASAVVKTDVNSLTKADREEIERRVLRGEKIRF